ncbi:heme NO-binding domain-containing protein [Magnetofaba australis]|uniref:Putative heme NO binding domain-containing protein n=1 Tax=Magnetofaba australis IT-1 TaxID=1434232 RepID=A0A1Y2K312_9PROT|nr:heme NO-binding domain-containing protein [Magnetofaba australis]OSM02411.1 putative heme NO binding domain-containing protein [Magnetofaba australis IT-1]
MLGIVFTEFSQMVEEAFSIDMLDDIIDMAENPHDGSYTAMGVYAHDELVALVGALSQKTGQPPEALVEAFGVHLLGRFRVLYPDFFSGKSDAFEFLEGIESTIHTHVRKLYPSAELPVITFTRDGDKIMRLSYKSSRPFAPLALGLVKGAMAHFNEPAEVEMSGSANDAVITITRQG